MDPLMLGKGSMAELIDILVRIPGKIQNMTGLLFPFPRLNLFANNFPAIQVFIFALGVLMPIDIFLLAKNRSRFRRLLSFAGQTGG